MYIHCVDCPPKSSSRRFFDSIFPRSRSHEPPPEMTDETLTEYERRRLENIRRNDEMMASLLVRRKAADLSASLKRRRPPDLEGKASREKRKIENPRPVAVRRSLRNLGLPPSDDPSQPSSGDPPLNGSSPSTDSQEKPFWKSERFLIRDAFVKGDDSSGDSLIEKIIEASDKSSSVFGKVGEEEDDRGSFDPRKDMVLRPGNVKKLVDGRILAIRFLPIPDRSVVAVGDKFGKLGFWDVDAKEGEGGGVYVYAPHSYPLSGISAHPLNPTKIFTCSYDGYARLMDVRAGAFTIIYCSDYPIYSICQPPKDASTLYFGEGAGNLIRWDERMGKVSCQWKFLHDQRINTIDVHPTNTNLMATSSTDGTACLWDVRKTNKVNGQSLRAIKHQRSVSSAFFSPDGSCIATTSLDNKVGIINGVNYEDETWVSHNNQTGRWLSSFRAIWGWDDSYLFIGNMKRALDVISTEKKTTSSLDSEVLTSIPCRFAAHPYKKGSLVGTSSGKVYLWSASYKWQGR